MAERKPNSNPIDNFWNWVDQLPLWVRIPIYTTATLILIALIYKMFSGSLSILEEDERESFKFRAVAECEERIRQILINPEGARFSPPWETKVTESMVTENTWTIRGWVDATNVFGATIRKSYMCRVHWRKESREWELLKLHLY